jgi:hypothetical protein
MWHNHVQSYACQYSQQCSRIGQSPQVDPLHAGQRLPGFRRGLLRVARERHGRYQQAAHPKRQAKNMSNKKRRNHGDHPCRSLAGCSLGQVARDPNRSLTNEECYS